MITNYRYTIDDYNEIEWYRHKDFFADSDDCKFIAIFNGDIIYKDISAYCEEDDLDELSDEWVEKNW